MIDKFLNSVVGADVKLPGVAGRVTTFRWIFHYDPLCGTVAQRQFLRALISNGGAAVPGKMQHEEQPVIVVAKSRIDFVPHEVRLAAELRTRIRYLHRFAVAAFAFVG